MYVFFLVCVYVNDSVFMSVLLCACYVHCACMYVCMNV
jgi:hypothetical protein